MNKTLRMLLFWILALVVTAIALYYQRATGPNHPEYVNMNFNGNDYRFKFEKDGYTDEVYKLVLPINDENVHATLHYKRYRVNEDFTPVAFKEGEEGVYAEFPLMDKTASKLDYFVSFTNDLQPGQSFETKHIVIRYNDHVPHGIMYPHILLMILTMLLSTLAAILAIARHPRARIYSFIAFGVLFLGGMVFGPFVQYYAFGEFWTGIPFGWDLTDNKTLIAFLVWIVAIIKNRKETNRRWIIIAAIVTLLVYSIPHSMFGSELDYNTGEIGQG